MRVLRMQGSGFSVLTATVLVAVSVFWTLAADYDYDGNGLLNIDASRPQQSEQASDCVGQSIRQTRAAAKGAVGVEHYLTGYHKTNFFQAYMAGSNSIDGASVKTNSLPGDRIKDGTIAPSKLMTTNTSGLFLKLITPVTVYSEGPDWTSVTNTFDASSYVTTNTRAVLLECKARASGNGVKDCQILVRAAASDPEYLLADIWDSDGGRVADSNQGFYPISTNQNFQYLITESRANTYSGSGITIKLVGYAE